jgi:hypothetical protein
MIRQVLQHVVHAAASAEVAEDLQRLELGVDPGPDEEDDEIALDLCGPSSLANVGHGPSS